jgi:diguanylate cyclase (GGDEF)-like protein
MKKPNSPPDEATRLETLRHLNILDTPAEERFDRISRIAKRLFNVSFALVSLVDENRQWFKSCIGLNASETPRDISFCGHAILGDDVFIVPDTTKDERFADNPLVINEPHIQFYAGCPIRSTNGSKLGTLCIIDQQPRMLTDDDLLALKDLASMVERELLALELATSDELTNLLNRRGFMMIGQNALAICIRHKTPAVILYLDLDNLKRTNDCLGHAEGDAMLITFADKLKMACRESDIIARLGGDEFVIMLINASIVTVSSITQRLQKIIDDYNRQKKTRQGLIEFSYGYAELDHKQHHTIEGLVHDADTQMYQNKKSKKVV